MLVKGDTSLHDLTPFRIQISATKSGPDEKITGTPFHNIIFLGEFMKHNAA